MTETKSERLGLRGRLAHVESTLRLLGGANATGAIAAGAAAVKTAAVLFLLGIFTFVIGYAGLFLAVQDIDHSLHKSEEPTWPKYLFWIPTKSSEEYQKQAKREFVVAMFGGLASFVLFFAGLGCVLVMAINLKLN